MPRRVRDGDPSRSLRESRLCSVHGLRQVVAAIGSKVPAAGLNGKGDILEFLVEFDIKVPDGTPESEVAERERAEAAASAKLEDEGHLVRVWKRPLPMGETTVLVLYRADSDTELHALLSLLRLYQCINVSVTTLEPHPNDPAGVLATT